ncbi:MAG: response regulator [Bacteroidia bacterium]|nr:response regulator [Bacteroidia bacterium]
MISLQGFGADRLFASDINSKIDALIAEQKSKLASVESSVEKAIYNNNLGVILSNEGRMDDAFFYFTTAQQLLTNSDCSPHKAFAETNIAYIESLRNSDLADDTKMMKSIFCARELKDVVLESEILLLDGHIKLHQGKYSDAFGSYFKAKELKESIQDNEGLIDVLIAISEGLTRVNQSAFARSYLQDALVLLKDNNNLGQSAKIYALLSTNYLKQKNTNYSNIYAAKSLEKAKAIESDFAIAKAYLIMSDINIALSDFQRAGGYNNRVKGIIEGSSINLLRYPLQHRKAQLNLALNKANDVISQSTSVINGKNQYASQYDIANSYELLTKAYYNLNDYKMAFEVNESFTELKQEQGISGAFREFEQLKNKSEQVVNETRDIQNKADNELLYQEQKTSEIVKYSIVFALILLSIILIVLYRQVRIKQTSNAKLEQRNSLINKQNQELRKMNSVLEESRQQAEAGSIAKSNFLAVTSHEIRTPMNGIMGMASLMLETPLNTEQKKYVETIQTSSENLLTILNDILDFSKIEAGKMNIESTLVDLDKLLEEVMIIFSKQAKDKNIELSKFIGNAMIKQFRGDVLRIRQILINLVSNAIKFTGNGYVKIIVELDELLRAQTEDARIAKLRFSVKDDGIGISEEKQKKIFESFEQEDTSTSRKYGGIGLGLSISKKLVELMGGEIGLTSEKNVGTTFYFTLNVEIPKGLAKQETPINITEEGKEVPVSTGKLADEYPLKILVAEDNPFNKLFIDKLFEKFGYNDSHHAENGLEVLKKLEHEEIDIILMDIQMPEMDGLQATQRIIEKYGDKRPVIIALTADANESSKHEYLNAGMDGFLSKPFKQEALQEILIENSKLIQAKELVG